MSPFTCHAIVCYWPKREEGKENSCILCYTCSRKVQLMTFKCPTHWMNTYKGIIIGTDVNKSCPMWALLTFGAWKFFVGDRLVSCWIYSSIPDLYTLDATSALPPIMTTKLLWSNVPQGTKALWLRATDLEWWKNSQGLGWFSNIKVLVLAQSLVSQPGALSWG